MNVILKKMSSLIVACSMVVIQPIPTIAVEDTTTTFVNTVLCVSFDDTSNFMNDNMYNDTTSYIDKLFDMFDNTDNKRSLTSYIDTISNGKMQIENVYPQYDGTSFDVYTMKHSKDYYNNSGVMVSEILNNISISNDIDMDGNNDGLIDNIIIIVEGTSSGREDLIYPHKSECYGHTINGLESSTYNLYDSNSLFDTYSIQKEGVIAHEFLHSLGYPDLYHYNDDGKNPVGGWDIMAQSSVFLQYPLGYERYAISNWIDATTITTDSTLTLYPVTSTQGNILYLFKTPMSDKEIFAVEYRQKGNSYNGELESKIYGSGLIIYRVDTSSLSNADGTDGIYVFRPNNTIGTDTQDGLTGSYLSEDSGRTSFGSSSLSDTSSDDAIVYADGSNSGIVISNVSSAGDTITFDVSFSDVSSNSIWNTVGDTAITNDYCSNIDLEVVSDKEIYSLCSAENTLDVYNYNGTSWSKVGNSVASMDTGYFDNAKISYCNGKLFVIYNDGSTYIPKIKTYDTSSNTWKDFYSVGEFAQYTEITSYNDDIYIAYTLGDYPEYSLNVVKIDANGNATTIGKDIATGVINPKIKVNDTGVYIAYRDINNNDILGLKHYDGSNWVDLSSTDISCNDVHLDLNGNKILVSVANNDNTTSIYEYDNQWNKLGDSFASNLACNACYNGDTPVVSIGIDNKTKAYEFIENSWSILGGGICDSITEVIELKSYSSTIYGLILTDSGYPYLKSYKTNSNTQPDITTETTTEVTTTLETSETTEMTTTSIIEDITTYTSKDLLKAKQICLGILEYDIQLDSNLDSNKDNKINVLDILNIKKYLLGI